jgi:acetyl esterase/lipase
MVDGSREIAAQVLGLNCLIDIMILETRRTDFHPDLYPLARFIPRSVHPGLIVRLLRLREALRRSPRIFRVPMVDGVRVKDVLLPGSQGAHLIRVRFYRPEPLHDPVPAMLWIHGGGFVMGDSEIDQDNIIATVREAGIAVAAVNYRLAPGHPFPAAIDDCYAALRWLHAEAKVLAVLPDRIAVGGSSAGGGLAAALALMAHDRKEVPVAFQLLIYPMLDDRTAIRTDMDMSSVRLWNNECNQFGWGSYLQSAPGAVDIHPYAAPARRESLSGLPPSWIGVGTCDLFHDEDVTYAKRLRESGVACELRVVEGAYHAFDLFSPKANVVKQFRQSYINAMKSALFENNLALPGE